MRGALAILLAVTGCSMGGDAGGDDMGLVDAGGIGDGAAFGCSIGYDPIDPVASSMLPIRGYVNVTATTGLPVFTWSVTFGGNPVQFTEQAANGSQIGFIAAAPGPYVVHVDITNVPTCLDAITTINVAAPGANTEVFRLRTVPATNLAPPQETFIQVKGGANAVRDITLDRGHEVLGLVKNGATQASIVAYLKFMPRSMPTAYSELISSSSGGYSLRLLPIDHDVLVIPAVATLAPKLVTWTAVPVTTQLVVGPGTAMTGTVRGPSGVGFGGAKVQLYAAGVPSTLGTTAADGSFSVRTDFPATATQITVKVTPPPGSGLPRLEATSAFVAPLNISYAAGLTTCDLANVPVRRVGADQANAQVTIAGALPGTAGAVNGVAATNTVRVGTTADGAGRLPSTLVPRGLLSAVVELSTTDHAAIAIDTSSCNVAQIDAPTMTTVSGTTRSPNNTSLGSVRVEAEPVGVLAIAGVAPVQVTSDASGAFSLPLAGGGRYNVRFTDPQQRAAPLVANNVAPGGVPTNAVLAKALAIGGDVKLLNTSTTLTGASVQILCATCAGLELTRPIAETASNSVGKYIVAVPDPGTM